MMAGKDVKLYSENKKSQPQFSKIKIRNSGSVNRQIGIRE